MTTAAHPGVRAGPGLAGVGACRGDGGPVRRGNELRRPRRCTLVIRYRRSGFEERQQIKWFAGASLLLAVLVVAATVVSFVVYHNGYVVFNPVGGIALPLGLAGLAAAIGISVLRYHLYGIGVFLRRALVYAVLVVLIGAIYLVLVVSIGTRIAPQTTAADRAIPFVVAAVLALIFQPVRNRLQRLANRLVYGKRATPYEVLANFSRGVSELYGDEDLTVRMARILSEGTEADRAEVWLRVGDELRLAASGRRGQISQNRAPTYTSLPSHKAAELI